MFVQPNVCVDFNLRYVASYLNDAFVRIGPRLTRGMLFNLLSSRRDALRALSLRSTFSKFTAATPMKVLECGPMPNVMVALPNIGGALC